MGVKELITCFQDTLEKSAAGDLEYNTLQAIKSNRVYKEEFVSKSPRRSEHSSIIVQAGTTFATARQYCSIGKVAVLNFANPVNPGGGVELGAVAQEECLCRSSNLYPCLKDSSVFDDYYLYHRGKNSNFSSDRLIYTKDITVFKNDDLIPELLPKSEWFTVDVITCAAPSLKNRKYTNLTALLSLFKRRVTNIFEAARDNDVDVIVLGAFGCGAFKNPPLIVAEAFKQVILEHNYLESFKQIVFAIKPTGEHCPNLNAFNSHFAGYAPDTGDGCCTLLPVDPLFMLNNRIPTFLSDSLMPLEGEFLSWQVSNKYFGKQFSVLGDSISTLDGFCPKGYNVFYKDDNCVKSGVTQMSDTWWDKVISFFGGELLVNNSWSGSKITKLPEKDLLFPSGCSDERTSSLHIDDIKPDVILVYLGTNDWAFGAKTGNETRILNEDENELFEVAYDRMLQKLRNNYPKSEIWCFTLCETYISTRPDFQFPHKHAGTHIEEYNDIIRDSARKNNCRLMDLYSYKLPYDSIDGSHPSGAGMNTLATMVIRAMAGQRADYYLDCKGGNHEYEMVDQYTGGTKYVCKKCAKMNHESNLFPKACPDGKHEYELCGQIGSYDFYRCKRCGSEKQKLVCGELNMIQNNMKPNTESEYVLLDPDRTTLLFSNVLKLTIESTSKTVQFQKDTVSVGRDPSCDLFLEGKQTVARRQATFFYEHESWFLRDDSSTNGTWLNGAKMQPGKKYELASNDEINFALAEKVIFYKPIQSQQQAGDPDAKALIYLEAGMQSFAKSQQTDEDALKLIIAALSNAPLIFPVEIDLEAMFGSVDPTKLKPGDTLQPQKDVRMCIRTMTLESGTEFVPLFTSTEELKKGPSTSTARYYPQDYLPKLIQMDKPVIINPFSEFRFILSKQLMTEVILPIVQDKTAAPTPSSDQEKGIDKYIGTVVGERYSVLKLIGQGGVANVYLAVDKHINKLWAIKICRNNLRNNSNVAKNIMLHEAEMVKKLNHPAIPKIVDVIDTPECFCIVQEYVEGESLENIVKLYGAQPVEQVIDWGKQLCNVLQYLHSLNPPHIYRDTKPANVILQPNGKIMLVDFGIMKVSTNESKVDEERFGTLGYAAPDLNQNDIRIDIYSLGITLHRLITGFNPTKPPYVCKPITQINPSLHKGLEYIISKCICPNPDERYQSCGELMADLSNYQNLPKPKGLFGKLFGKK